MIVTSLVKAMDQASLVSRVSFSPRFSTGAERVWDQAPFTVVLRTSARIASDSDGPMGK